MGTRSELFVTIKNVFNKALQLPAISDNAYSDLLGRSYRVEMRFGV